MSNHYALIKDNEIIADCLVPNSEPFPAQAAIHLLKDMSDQHPDAAIYMRIGGQDPLPPGYIARPYGKAN